MLCWRKRLQQSANQQKPFENKCEKKFDIVENCGVDSGRHDRAINQWKRSKVMAYTTDQDLMRSHLRSCRTKQSLPTTSRTDEKVPESHHQTDKTWHVWHLTRSKEYNSIIFIKIKNRRNEPEPERGYIKDLFSSQ